MAGSCACKLEGEFGGTFKQSVLLLMCIRDIKQNKLIIFSYFGSHQNVDFLAHTLYDIECV